VLALGPESFISVSSQSRYLNAFAGFVIIRD